MSDTIAIVGIVAIAGIAVVAIVFRRGLQFTLTRQGPRLRIDGRSAGHKGSLKLPPKTQQQA